MPTELKGGSQLRKALRKFEPDLAKALTKEMAVALKPIVVKARGFIPVESTPRNWRKTSFAGRWPFYDSALMRGGIGYKTTPTKPNRSGFSYLASINNKTASGAIFETAGRKNPQGQPWVGPKKAEGQKKFSHSNNPNAGSNFIRHLPVMYGSGKFRGRAIFKAWDQDNGQVNGAVMKAIQMAANEFRKQRGTL
ncbi:MAG: hypothetical protein HQ473_07820 [Cryomorphaceae bacterium]|nr:hypothetical protein [Cryomorphaceae bacterium]